MGVLQYAQDWDERLPPAQTAAAVKPLILPYVRDSAAFVDSNTGSPFQYNASLAGTVLATYASPSTFVVFYELSPPVPNARPVVVLDGRTELLTASQWQQLEATSQITPP